MLPSRREVAEERAAKAPRRVGLAVRGYNRSVTALIGRVLGDDSTSAPSWAAYEGQGDEWRAAFHGNIAGEYVAPDVLGGTADDAACLDLVQLLLWTPTGLAMLKDRARSHFRSGVEACARKCAPPGYLQRRSGPGSRPWLRS